MTSKAYAVSGLFFGDEGKGSIVDFLSNQPTPSPTTVVKSSGGAQCAHNVVRPDGSHHTFAQIGAGAFHSAPTYLSEYFVFNPVNFWREIEALGPLAPVFAHPMMPVVTEYHRAANRAREDARGDNRHGSTGQGIGELQSDLIEDRDAVIRACMLPVPEIIRDRLRYWRDRKRTVIQGLGQPVPDFFYDDHLLESYVKDFVECPIEVSRDDYLVLWSAGLARVIFEGGQGALLDEYVGFHPHTTWGRTTSSNAQILAERLGLSDLTSIGVIRAYMTRHGAGPMPTEDPELEYPELHNRAGKYQGAFRLGHLDLMMLDYAMTVSSVDELAVNHLDLISLSNWRQVKICVGYKEMDRIPVIDPGDFEARAALTEELFHVTPIYERFLPEDVVDVIEERTRVSVKYAGWGPGRGQKRVRHFPDLKLTDRRSRYLLKRAMLPRSESVHS